MQFIKGEKEFDEFVKSNKYVLVDFYAKWCGPCNMMSPHLEEVSQDPDFQDVKIVKVDVDENMELANRYKIYSIPALYVFKGDIVEANKAIGYHTTEELKELIIKNRG